MTRRRCALAAVGVLLAARAAAAPVTAWVVPFLGRVGVTDPPGSTTSATLHAARGEYEPFQLAVRAPEGGLTNVRVRVSDLAGPAGTIPSSSVTSFLERYVNVPRSTYCKHREGNCPGPPGAYPDGLVPFSVGAAPNARAVPFTVAAGRNQPIWLDVLVPREAAPGVYSGRVTVTADQGSAAIPVQLTVWAFELPVRPSLRTSFGLHRGKRDPRHQAVLVQHRIMPWQVPAANARQLASIGLHVAGLPLVSNQSGCALDPAPDVSRLRAAIAEYPADVDLYVYVADEPRAKCPDPARWVPQLRSWSRSLHETRAKALVTVPPMEELLDDGSGRPAVDIWVMLPKQWDPTDHAFQAARARGGELWAYTALVQDAYSPKWAIDFAPMDHRVLMGFLAHALALDGVLYWSVDHWGADPWANPMFACCGGREFAGEGLLVYPGEPVGVAGPVPSMRLKWIREGVDDHDYLALLAAAGRGDFALQVARSVASDWRTWSKDPAVLERARLRLGEELSRLAAAASGATEKRTPSPAERRRASIQPGLHATPR